MTAASEGDASARSGEPAGSHWAQTGLVLAAFLSYSFLCRPIPSVNEPHYLAKARHYWQPGWCANDFFLESSNPHLVFYQTLGALTHWLTLTESAVIGRVLALSLLAWGWTRLMLRLDTHRWAPVGVACLFLLLQALGNFSGEWLVGGVESKVVAYALAFAAWSFLFDRRLAMAGLLLGLAISFHAVVGVWCLVATVMGLGGGALFRNRLPVLPSRPPLSAWVLGAVLLAVASLPGLIPALQTLGTADGEAAALADRYQVGTRLAHHLDPMAFPVSAYRYYGLLILLWLLMRRRLAEVSLGQRLFTQILIASLVIAGVGILVGWGPRPLREMPLADMRVWLLKFYPFRLADLLVPVGVSLSAFAALTRSSQFAHRRTTPALVALAALAIALWIPGPDRNPSRMSAAQHADWLAACEWIREQTPAEALLYAANEDWAVRWFTHRAEYVNYKDTPQDAAGILEWVRRLKTLRRWHQQAYRDRRISGDELQQLHAETGITHLLASRLGPVDITPVYRNESFRVYDIGSL